MNINLAHVVRSIRSELRSSTGVNVVLSNDGGIDPPDPRAPSVLKESPGFPRRGFFPH